MKCPHCGHEQEDGKFCDMCGLALPKAPTKKIEDKIKKEEEELDREQLQISKETHRCGQCGYSFKGRRCPNCGTLYRHTLV
ncbi:MAG: hypothetical protein GXP49_14965 [Deltaproteobacteria bacterium]|nr:hypothetical protein [Deltaproteobacteria bacterium]